jgi:acyl-CoA thioester hydrolase
MNPDLSAPSTPEPPGGWFEGRTHVFPVRVYYEDTDFSGVVYHANYLRFMERGRSEFLRLAGAGHQGMLEGSEPLVWAVRRMSIDFAKPARMEEALTVRTTVLELAGARMRLDQAVLRGAETLVKAEVEVCVITLDGRPRRVPDSTRKKLEFFLET